MFASKFSSFTADAMEMLYAALEALKLKAINMLLEYQDPRVFSIQQINGEVTGKEYNPRLRFTQEDDKDIAVLISEMVSRLNNELSEDLCLRVREQWRRDLSRIGTVTIDGKIIENIRDPDNILRELARQISEQVELDQALIMDLISYLNQGVCNSMLGAVYSNFTITNQGFNLILLRILQNELNKDSIVKDGLKITYTRTLPIQAIAEEIENELFRHQKPDFILTVSLAIDFGAVNDLTDFIVHGWRIEKCHERIQIEGNSVVNSLQGMYFLRRGYVHLSEEEITKAKELDEEETKRVASSFVLV